MYFAYLKSLSINVLPKFVNYMKFLEIFERPITKCKDLIGKDTPLPARSLCSCPSMKLKLFLNHYETPCMKYED